MQKENAALQQEIIDLKADGDETKQNMIDLNNEIKRLKLYTGYGGPRTRFDNTSTQLVVAAMLALAVFSALRREKP